MVETCATVYTNTNAHTHTHTERHIDTQTSENEEVKSDVRYECRCGISFLMVETRATVYTNAHTHTHIERHIDTQTSGNGPPEPPELNVVRQHLAELPTLPTFQH